MSHRRDQKETLRREREERERRAREAERRKRLVLYGGGALAVVAAVVLVVVLAGGGGGDATGAGGSSDTFPDGGSFPEQRVFDVAPAARAAGCELRSERGGEEATHTTSPDERVDYQTNPPTTGRHYEVPAEDGIYGEAPADETVPHAMEHGRVVFWVKPSLPAEQRADVRALVDDDPYQVLLIPRSNMPYAVAATAWNGEPAPEGTGRLLVCERMNDRVFDALAAFRDEHRSRGAEPVP